MKVYEMSFRDMNQKMVEIHGMKMVKLLEKMGLKLDNLYGALMYGYIDHNAGFIFEIVALETKKRNIEYRIVPIGVSCKIPRFDVQEMDIQILDNVNVELFQDKIDMVEKATEVSKELEELRLYKELDPSRHLEYPDDIMVYFLDEGKDVEACWVRLEGGAFYLGDDEYEKFITTGIQDCLNQLGFDRSQLILSGLSMGTFGALYNGCKLQPHAIIIGKPLASLGDIAVNERISRPGGFPTSLDVLVKNCGDMSQKSIDSLNHHFWDLFDQTDWSQTKFIVSYMLEDDYDMTAYDRLISHIDDVGVEIIGKGIHGRHNDDTYSIVAWFKNQYDGILKSDFGRGDLDEE